MKYDIEAKPTKYKGRLYRSRLEARWAAYLDILGLEYEYEPCDLGEWSPDFRITDLKRIWFAEVKPVHLSSEEKIAVHQKMFRAANHSANLLYLSEPYVDYEEFGLAPLTGNSWTYTHDGVVYNEFSIACALLDGGFVTIVPHNDDHDYRKVNACRPYFKEKWIEAGNKVMFLKPVSK